PSFIPVISFLINIIFIPILLLLSPLFHSFPSWKGRESLRIGLVGYAISLLVLDSQNFISSNPIHNFSIWQGRVLGESAGLFLVLLLCLFPLSFSKRPFFTMGAVLFPAALTILGTLFIFSPNFPSVITVMVAGFSIIIHIFQRGRHRCSLLHRQLLSAASIAVFTPAIFFIAHETAITPWLILTLQRGIILYGLILFIRRQGEVVFERLHNQGSRLRNEHKLRQAQREIISNLQRRVQRLEAFETECHGLRDIIQNLPVPFIICSMKGNILWCNSKCNISFLQEHISFEGSLRLEDFFELSLPFHRIIEQVKTRPWSGEAQLRTPSDSSATITKYRVNAFTLEAPLFSHGGKGILLTFLPLDSDQTSQPISAQDILPVYTIDLEKAKILTTTRDQLPQNALPISSTLPANMSEQIRQQASQLGKGYLLRSGEQKYFYYPIARNEHILKAHLFPIDEDESALQPHPFPHHLWEILRDFQHLSLRDPVIIQKAISRLAELLPVKQIGLYRRLAPETYRLVATSPLDVQKLGRAFSAPQLLLQLLEQQHRNQQGEILLKSQQLSDPPGGEWPDCIIPIFVRQGLWGIIVCEVPSDHDVLLSEYYDFLRIYGQIWTLKLEETNQTDFISVLLDERGRLLQALPAQPWFPNPQQDAQPGEPLARYLPESSLLEWSRQWSEKPSDKALIALTIADASKDIAILLLRYHAASRSWEGCIANGTSTALSHTPESSHFSSVFIQNNLHLLSETISLLTRTVEGPANENHQKQQQNLFLL
ncbi:MAG: hypothetical protein D6820_13320, partial [Lentisphaerae bacterium]